jgi:hypothetical protein
LRRSAKISNDDGVESEGLGHLALAAVEAGVDAVVAAPMTQASGSSASITGEVRGVRMARLARFGEVQTTNAVTGEGFLRLTLEPSVERPEPARTWPSSPMGTPAAPHCGRSAKHPKW